MPQRAGCGFRHFEIAPEQLDCGNRSIGVFGFDENFNAVRCGERAAACGPDRHGGRIVGRCPVALRFDRAINPTALDRFGFEEIYLEQMSLSEQIQRISNAEAVLGPHGAGMSQCIFMKKGSLVIEFFHPQHMNVCMWPIHQYTHFFEADRYPQKYREADLLWLYG